MTGSVPKIVPLGDVQWRLASLLERAVKVYETTGDINALDQATRLTREVYESALKVAGNKGTMDWDYINKCRLALEKVEGFIHKVKEHYETGRG